MKFVLKSKIIKTILTIALIGIISVSFIYTNLRKHKSEIAAQNSAADESQVLTENIFDSSENYVSQNYYSKSPNGEISAEVVRENGFNSILIKNKDNVEGLVLENLFYTNIESTEWLDDTRYAICGHVNPSLEVYIIIDTQKRQIIGKYDGIGFTWNKNKNRLYYIETSPNYNEPITDRIIDNEGNIYFETQKGQSIINSLAISDDEQSFAFYIDDSKNESRKIIVAKMDKNNKLRQQTSIDAQFGIIEFNNKSITVTNSVGAVYYYGIY